MKAHILDASGSRSMNHRKSLEEAGFAVMNASDETQAVNFLKLHRVDVACVDSSSLNRGRTSACASIKGIKPHVLILLIWNGGMTPDTLGQHVAIAINESDS